MNKVKGEDVLISNRRFPELNQNFPHSRFIWTSSKGEAQLIYEHLKIRLNAYLSTFTLQH